jgi:hypothetical protein
MEIDLQQRRNAIDVARAADAATPELALVDPVVRASWQRSATSVEAAVDAAPVEDSSVTRQRWDDSPIRRTAPRLAEHLDQIATTSDLATCVTDADGRVLWQSIPRWLRRGAERIGFMPGGLWHEAAMGTNGVGLSLAADRPAAVFASEHWIDHVHDWVCYAAPIHGPDGTQVGAVDLSTTWKHANPLALSTVASLALLIEHELRIRADVFGPRPRVLEVQVMGEPAATLDGVPLRLTQRQFEILTILAVTGGATLGELHALLYGDRPVAPTTLKAEISHLRRALDGNLASRPYRLDLPYRIDAVELPERLERGDLERATRLYAGQLIPASESPYIVDLRHELDVAFRTALLREGTSTAVLRYTAVHPYDSDVLERVGALVPLDDPLYPAVTARLAVARTA